LSISKTVGLVQIYNKNVVLRRIQYPAKIFQAGTIHKSTGDDVPKLATEINTSSKTNQLWDLKQLVVLLSRVQKLSDITFVGNKTNTLEALRQTMEKRTVWDNLINDFVEMLQSRNNYEAMRNSNAHYNFSFHSCELPETDSGVVFAALNLSKKIVLIEESVNIRKSLKKLNTVSSRDSIEDPEPGTWAIIAAVYGFSTSSYNSLRDEAKFKWRHALYPENSKTELIDKVIASGLEVANEMQFFACPLNLVFCKYVTRNNFLTN